MKLKVGDVVEFKNYADMSIDDTALIEEDRFPESGKVTEVNELYNDITFFNIEGSPYNFNSGSVARVISDVDVNKLNTEDKILAKVTVKGIFADGIRISSQIKTSDIVKILKRKDPERKDQERFIVKEDRYGMYIYGFGVLISNKNDAKIYSSRNEANEAAANMHLNAWDVIPYDA